MYGSAFVMASIYHGTTDFCICVLLSFWLYDAIYIPVEFQLLALHSNFNFIQFVFTIYYLSVYCALTFRGYLADIRSPYICVHRMVWFGLVCKWLLTFNCIHNTQYTNTFLRVYVYVYKNILIHTHALAHIFYVLPFSTLMFCLLFASGCFYFLH